MKSSIQNKKEKREISCNCYLVRKNSLDFGPFYVPAFCQSRKRNAMPSDCFQYSAD